MFCKFLFCRLFSACTAVMRSSIPDNPDPPVMSMILPLLGTVNLARLMSAPLGLIALGLCVLTTPMAAFAGEMIGVAAALSGDVIRVSSTNNAKMNAPLQSGSKVYLGDEIKVADGGRMQIMLLDETVFTLGSGARLMIDKFIFDPTDQTGEMTARITKGAFRFVSGKLAKSSPTAMKVTLPSASISIRGTQVAGIVDEFGRSEIILVGPGPNIFGAPLGAITVTNALGSVDLTRPNFSTIVENGSAPAAPQQVAPTTIRALQQSTREDAETEIAIALGVEKLEDVPDTDPDADADSDADSDAGSVQALLTPESKLGASIIAATSGSAATNDGEILSAAYAAMVAAGTNESEAGSIEFDTLGLNFGGDITTIIDGNVEYLGATTLDQLLNAGLTGSTTYSATGVAMSCSNSSASGCGGSFDVSDTWNFAAGTMSQDISNGQVQLDYSGNGTIDANLAFSFNSTLDYSASGPLAGNLVTSGPNGAMPGNMAISMEINPALARTAYGSGDTYANIGTDDQINRLDWTSVTGAASSVTDQGGTNLPGNIVFVSDAYLANVVVGDQGNTTSSTGSIAGHDLQILDASGNELATATVIGMASQ